MNGQAEQSSTSYTAAADNTKKRTEYEDPDGSFRQYMRIKQQKLVDQLPIAQSQLFSKVTAYITGYTGNEIGDLELKRLIHSNGGRVVQYYSAGSVTHVICLQLAGGKAQQLGKAKGLQIVRPQWVLDCVKRGRLLPESQYAVIKSATQAVPVKNSILSFLNNSKDKSMR